MDNPLQFKFAFNLWTRQGRGSHREEVWHQAQQDIRRPLLDQLGLTEQRPPWMAYQQNPEAVDRWLEDEVPANKRAATRCKVEIYFSDEAGIRSGYHLGSTWAP